MPVRTLFILFFRFFSPILSFLAGNWRKKCNYFPDFRSKKSLLPAKKTIVWDFHYPILVDFISGQVRHVPLLPSIAQLAHLNGLGFTIFGLNQPFGSYFLIRFFKVCRKFILCACCRQIGNSVDGYACFRYDPVINWIYKLKGCEI